MGGLHGVPSEGGGGVKSIDTTQRVWIDGELTRVVVSGTSGDGLLTDLVGDLATGFSVSLSLVLSLSVEEVDEGRGLGHERSGKSLPDRFDSRDKSFDLLGDGGDHKILLTDVIVDLVDVPGTTVSVGLETGLSELEKFLLGVERNSDLLRN